MGVENRAGNRYYYRKIKKNGRVRSKYVGPISDPATANIARLGALERAGKRELLAQRKAELAHVAELDAPLLELIQFNRLLVKATLIANGYRQHERGEWRRQRVDQGHKND